MFNKVQTLETEGLVQGGEALDASVKRAMRARMRRWSKTAAVNPS
jgi:hypothetical protein